MQKEQWKIEVNDRYQKVISTLMGLATASLVLPVLFLRSFLSVPQNQPLSNYLCDSIYWSWTFWCLSVVSGTIFYYLSAKWVKNAWGQKTSLTPKAIEISLDWAFWLTCFFFIIGLCFFVNFAVTFKVAS